MRWIIRSVVALVVLVLLAIVAVFMIPAEKVAALAAAQFKTLSGRDLVIDGAVKPSFWPVLGVKTGPIHMSNADWATEGPMLQADGLSIAVDMAALIAGTVKITGIEATNPRFVLERSKTGQENWMFGGGGSAGTISTETPGVGQAYTMDKAVISGGTLLFVDHGTGQRVELSRIEATVKIPDYVGPAQMDLAAVLNGQSFSAGVTLGAYQGFLDGNAVPLDLSLKAGDADVAFSGRGGYAPLQAEGDLTAHLGNLAAISALAGAAAPGLPEGLGARKVSVAGKVTLTAEGAVFLRGGKVDLDDNALAVDADLATSGARPKLSAKVSAGALNLAGLSGGAGGGAGGGAQAAGWPQDRIDASALSVMDAAVALSVDSLDLGLAKFGPSQIMLTNERSRAVADIRKMAGYGGTISGQFVVNNRSGLSVGGDLSFAGMDLQHLLKDFGGYERLVGTGDLKLNFLGAGESVDAIMHSLKGSGSFALSKGEILGLDIAGMLRTMDTNYVGEGQKTIFDAITATFQIAQGVLTNDDLAFSSEYLTAAGKGWVGLGERNQKYRISATALAGAVGEEGITAPLIIGGTWAKPTFALDLAALAEQKLGAEKARLEAELRAKAADEQARLEALAAQKLQDELGVVQQPGESLEDAARRGLQEQLGDQATKALEDMLNGN